MQTDDSSYQSIIEFFTEQTHKWGEFSIHDTDPPTFTATLTEDKDKLHKIREYIKTDYGTGEDHHILDRIVSLVFTEEEGMVLGDDD